jgi:hypothetical protein
MAWHGSNDFGEKAPTAPISKSPRPIAEVREYTHKALVVCECISSKRFHMFDYMSYVARIG